MYSVLPTDNSTFWSKVPCAAPEEMELPISTGQLSKILMEDQNKHVSVSLSSFWLGVVAVGVGSFLTLIFSWAGATHASNSCDTNVTAHMYLPLRAAVMSCGSLHWIESIQWERQEVTLAILWQLMTAPHFYIHLLIHLWVGCVQVLEPVAIRHLTNLNKSNGNT